MKPRPSLPPSAFTLIELLTVISIIAILMGLLFPAISIVKNSANKARAGTDVANIVTAVKQYNAEYGKFPALEKAPEDAEKDAACGDPIAEMKIDNNALFYTLRAIAKGDVNTTPSDHSMNPRKVNFFDGKSASDPAQPRSGFADKTGVKNEGCFFDPWGKQYNIVIDTNYDNVIGLEEKYKDFKAPNEPRVTVGAFSMGKDNILGDKKFTKSYRNGQTVADDVVSWQ